MTEDSTLYRTLGPIYISSIQPLLDNENLHQKYKIKTIISVTKSDIPLTYTKEPYVHLQVSVDDLPTEIILPFIPKVNQLILKTIYKSLSKDVLDRSLIEENEVQKPSLSGDAVLIHCQSGVSRSVTFACAYLMNRHNLSLTHALHAIRRNNPNHTFQPNEGFMEQLEIYKESGWCVDVSKLRKISPRWRAYRMEHIITSMIHSGTTADDGKDNNFSTIENSTEKDANWFGFKCAKCRSLLASSEVYIPHSPPFEKDDKQMYFIKNAFRSKRVVNVQRGHNECTLIFTEPLLWMRNKLVNEDSSNAIDADMRNEDNEALEGRLDCYKCGAKVGGWNWKGGRCSCGKWMVPAINLLKSKVIQTDRNNKMILPNDDRAV
ncbi:hypothetical protein PMKS-002119 [Pichia membranifaciens]|uniref:protein-tyrosine-phosphatase n=1 Tax=Pichia membranifaciens TaxID=4926 RepID=A0A1Q2YGN8_9ASCO|nr:hypothetical protein PMKS-002119 [Pichia membranifaciens]